MLGRTRIITNLKAYVLFKLLDFQDDLLVGFVVTLLAAAIVGSALHQSPGATNQPGWVVRSLRTEPV